MCDCGTKTALTVKVGKNNMKKTRSAEDLVDEALGGLDEMTGEGIKSHILKLKPVVKEEVTVAGPVDGEEGAEGEEYGHSEPDGDEGELPPDLKEKLLALLAE